MRLACAGLAVAAAAWGQGTVVFNNRVDGQVVCHVYFGTYMALWGNSPTETPPGTVNWAGFGLASGSEISAALLAAPGADAPDSNLVPAQPVTTFRTGSAAGFVAMTTATFPNVPKDAPVATVQMVAWENKRGHFTNWAQARAAWQAGILRAGTSARFNVYAVGGDFNVPPCLLGLRSFNILDPSMLPPPQILAQPQSQLAMAGQTVTFQVVASSTVPLDYLWCFNRGLIPGATGNTLVLTNVQPSHQGTYTVLVWSQSAGSVVGSTVSQDAFLQVISRPPVLEVETPSGGLEPDGFCFTLRSDPGLFCGVQRSTNLATWQEFLTVTNSTGQIRLKDPGALSVPGQYYRAVARLP